MLQFQSFGDMVGTAPCLAHRHGGKGTSEDALLMWQTLFLGNFCHGRCTGAGIEEPDFTTEYFFLLWLFPYPVVFLCLASEQNPTFEQSWVL